MSLMRHYELAIEAAIEAGIAIKSIYESNNYDIELKLDDSPVTRADKTSSAIIAQFLAKTSFPIIDEEHCCPDHSIRKHWKNLWLVDPMDGTKEFISGNGEFTVNIALIENCQPVFGVIYSPVNGVLYWGGRMTGSFIIEEVRTWKGVSTLQAMSRRLQPEKNIGLTLRAAASRSHLDSTTSNFIDRLKGTFGEIDFVSKGSSLKLCMIAEGTTDIYPRFSRTMEWDTAAGHAIVVGTGGVLLEADTLKEIEYNKPDLSNPSFFALSGPQYIKGLKYF